MTEARAPQLRHVAWEATGEEEDVAVGAAELLRVGARDGARPVVVAPTARLEALERAGLPDGTELHDVERVARNPARLVPFWLDVADRAADRPVVGLNESVHPGRDPDRLAEAVRGEALLHRALAPAAPLVLCCLLDAGRLPPAARSTTAQAHHGSVPDAAAVRTFTLVGGPVVVAPAASPALVEPPSATVVATVRDLDELHALRPLLRAVVGAQLADADRAEDLLLAVHELAVNGLEHGGEVHVRTWAAPTSVVVEVADHGRLTDPLAGLVRPAPTARRGRGLWLVHQLVDLVQQRSGPTGTVTRLHVDR